MSRPDPWAWSAFFTFDPVTPLAESDHPAVSYWARRHLFGDRVGPPSRLWATPVAARLLRAQRPDGSWRYASTRSRFRSEEAFDLLETYHVFGDLVEKFGLTRKHPQLRAGAEYLLGAQSKEGDIRGIYGNQYSPNYTAGMIELLVKAGYGDDPRIGRAFGWLLQIRQQDGGWAIPLRTQGMNLRWLGGTTVEPDRSRPFSHLVTGVVLRAFAAHPRYRRHPAARHGARLLASRLFTEDAYPDRKGSDYWTRFSFPFLFTDLTSALDSLGRIGHPGEDPAVRRALRWLADRQRPDGLFEVRMLRTRDKHLRQWLTLAICRAARRFERPMAGTASDPAAQRGAARSSSLEAERPPAIGSTALMLEKDAPVWVPGR